MLDFNMVVSLVNNLSSTYYMSGTILATGDIAVNKTKKMSAFLELHTKRGWGMGTEDVLDSNKCYGEK